MDIRDVAAARAWLRAWGGKPRRGILVAAIDGVALAAALAPQGEARKLHAAARFLRRTLKSDV